MATLLTTTYQQVGTIFLTYGEIRLYARYSSQDNANNLTNFDLKTTYYTSQNTISFSTADNYLYGTHKSFNGSTFYRGETTLIETSRQQYHEQDGSSPIVNIGTVWEASFGGNGEVYTDITFPKIDRYPIIVNAPNFTDEENPTITYTTTSGFSGATYQACISLTTATDDIPYRAVNLENGSYTFNLTTTERNTLRNATPNSNTLNVVFILKTTVNGTDYFSSVTRTMTIINNAPTHTHTEIETNQKVVNVLGTNNANTIIKNASIMRATIVPSAKKGATISSVNAQSTGYSRTLTSPPYVFDIPMKTTSYAILTIDSRGNSRADRVKKTLIDYNPVSLTSFEFKRENPTSSTIIVNLEAYYFQQTFGSTTNVPTVKWKLNNGTETTIPSSNYVIDNTNHKLTISNYEISDALVYTEQGTFTIIVSDLLTTARDSQEVLRGIPTTEKGKHDFQVNGDLYVADVNRENKVNILEKIKDLESKNNYSTSETEIGKWINGDTIYRKCFHTTNIGTAFTVSHGISNYGVTVNAFISASYSGVGSYVGGERSDFPLYITNIDSTKINCVQSGFNDWDIYIILEYTKGT